MPDQPEPPKRPRGRPPAPPGMARDAKIDGRITKAQHEAYTAAGGIDWLRAMLEKYTPAALRALLKSKT